MISHKLLTKSTPGVGTFAYNQYFFYEVIFKFFFILIWVKN